MKSILLIEDDAIMGESLAQRLEIEGLNVRWCRSLAEAERYATPGNSAVVCDVRLPDGLATDWYVQLPAAVRNVPWFFLTGYGSVNDAITAVRAGAREYLTKPFDIEKLVGLVQAALANAPAPDAKVVLGISAAMRKVEAIVTKVAQQKVSVLINGESGVGKEVAAQLIHSLDPRTSKGDFVAVNCAAIPETMLEAEFFGYEKGAFSGATRQHRGYLERADHGTLFLDEVGELPASMQAKLLRVLQEKCFFRLGSERTTCSDFRILAATNRDLYADMSAGSFREDLFYRLAVIRITIPPLRERPDDIRWLTEKLLATMVIEQGRPIAMSESFMRDIMGRDWRGNVRELRSYLEQAVVFSDAGVLDEPLADRPASGSTAPPPSEDIVTLQAMVEETERTHIRRALNHCESSVGKTADLLGISRKTLWEKMKRLAISV
ncbi:MAG: sigma-54 dependent transcriptional regulator [Betaproteobacteria bacterium]